MNIGFKEPKQLLRNEAYFDPAWFERERKELFDQAWTYACTEDAIGVPGDYHCFRFMHHALLVVRDEQGDIRAFHNICRHRGCEVLEGGGNTGTAIVCPYHRWTYGLNGSLRAVPNERECFDVLPKEKLALHRASVGIYRGMVFVNPSVEPKDGFDAWIANLEDHSWPHDLSDGSIEYVGETTYEMRCNWKVFYENAIDGYHLGYLHEKTLGKLLPGTNSWKAVGRNVVWYSTEREGPPQSNSVLSAEIADGRGTRRIPGHELALYPGVVMMFPLTILSPSPWGFYVSLLEPISPEATNLRVYSWAPKGSKGRFKTHKPDSPVRLGDLDVHPLESGSFQIEDMWICEKIQRNLRSPKFEFGPLAKGDGAEAPLMHFQESVLEYVPIE